jgi:hypothetical protein
MEDIHKLTNKDSHKVTYDIPPNIQDQKAKTIDQDPEQTKPSLPLMKPAW